MEKLQEKWPQELAEIAVELDKWGEKPNLENKSVFSIYQWELHLILIKLDKTVTWLRWDSPTLADEVLIYVNDLDKLVWAGQFGYDKPTESTGTLAKYIVFQLAEKLRDIVKVAKVKTKQKENGGEGKVKMGLREFLEKRTDAEAGVIDSKIKRIKAVNKQKEILPKTANKPKGNQTKLYYEIDLENVWYNLKNEIPTLPNLIK